MVFLYSTITDIAKCGKRSDVRKRRGKYRPGI